MFQTFLSEWELIESMLLVSGPLIGSSFSYAQLSRCVLLHLTFELSCSISGRVFTRSLHRGSSAVQNLWKFCKISCYSDMSAPFLT